jgi:prepilin-type N-terminal cleavage/methylation domain-containing protein
MNSLFKLGSSRFKQGFTLAELIVVIGIIGLLAGIILTSISQARANSRDKNQKSEIKQLQLALGLYREANGSYPIVAAGGGGDSCLDAVLTNGDVRTNSSTENANCPTKYIDEDEVAEEKITPYMRNVPNHLLSKASDCRYLYMTSVDGSAYKLVAENCAETGTIVAGEAFSRCPASKTLDSCDPDTVVYQKSFSIYSPGAEAW